MVNMRPFNRFEQGNIKFLVNHSVKFTQVEVTATGLKKSILDATAPMRTYFIENGIHDYEIQKQGQEHKETRRTVILTATEEIETKATFYRPNTKKGDPRMWIYGLGSHSKESDIHVLFFFNDTLFSVNITEIDIAKCCNTSIGSPLQEIIMTISSDANSVAEELLGRFRSVSGEWFESEVTADTGIGRTIETFLGIRMNSDKTPDYKGIELKSHRERRRSSKNVLFTQTPDWDISILKSGRQIVEKYGYPAPNGVKTYQNTVQCSPPNSQSLFLCVNTPEERLDLRAAKEMIEDVAAWRLRRLHQRLLQKHRETFWIEVENAWQGGREFFRYKKIEYTKNPNVGQFDILLEQSIITVDLLLCRPSGHGDTYSFKIKRMGMPLLFPESEIFEI